MNLEIILQNYKQNRNIKLLNNIGYEIKNDSIFYNNTVVFQLFNNIYYKFGLFKGEYKIIKRYEYNKLLSYNNIKNIQIIHENNKKYVYSNIKNKLLPNTYTCKQYNSSHKLYRTLFYNSYLISAYNYYYSKNKCIILCYKIETDIRNILEKYTYQYSILFLFI